MVMSVLSRCSSSSSCASAADQTGGVMMQLRLKLRQHFTKCKTKMGRCGQKKEMKTKRREHLGKHSCSRPCGEPDEKILLHTATS